MYLRIINNEIDYPYSLQKLREDNPNISFPSEMTESLMGEWNIHEVRQTRNELLLECDWTQLSDIPQSVKDEWSSYRQELRDITSQSNPYNIIWPNKP